MDWQPIETVPKDRARRVEPVLLASFRHLRDDDGEQTSAMEMNWCQVAHISHAGWMVSTDGFVGVHGHARFPIAGATHWMPLPDAPNA